MNAFIVNDSFLVLAKTAKEAIEIVLAEKPNLTMIKSLVLLEYTVLPNTGKFAAKEV